jgi:prepilin-type N-terminal cleavage/methylation domain-containing protein
LQGHKSKKQKIENLKDMNKLLPKTKYNQNGFTLVELLVVIVILAILGIVGITIFTGTQSKARDAKRKEDIGAMSSAAEANYRAGTGYFTSLDNTWFADGIIPANPAPNGNAYYTTSMSASSYTFCAALENSTGNATSSVAGGMGASAGSYFCKKNAQ